MPLQSALIGAGNTIKSVVVLLSSMTPILENKGSILLGAALNLKWYLAYIGSSIGSFLPVPFLLRAGERGLNGIRRSRLGAKALRRTDEFVQRHRGFFDRRGCLALALIVSIPFTGIGCWAGVLLSDLLGLDRRRSACAILIGIAISGFLTTAATYGLLLGVRQLILN